jgi:hypothetical protein
MYAVLPFEIEAAVAPILRIQADHPILFFTFILNSIHLRVAMSLRICDTFSFELSGITVARRK